MTWARTLHGVHKFPHLKTKGHTDCLSLTALCGSTFRERVRISETTLPIDDVCDRCLEKMAATKEKAK